MKLTESKLRQIIREEASALFEYDDSDEFSQPASGQLTRSELQRFLGALDGTGAFAKISVQIQPGVVVPDLRADVGTGYDVISRIFQMSNGKWCADFENSNVALTGEGLLQKR